MNEVNKIIDRMRIAFNVKRYADLAHKLGVSPSTIDTWKRRGEVPEKHILKSVHLTAYDENFIKFGIKNSQNSSNTVVGNGNISFSGSGNQVSGNNANTSNQSKDYDADIKEICELLQEYGSPKMIKDLRDKLYQIRELHG